MGTEFGQRNEWNFRTELDWKESLNPLNKGVTKFLRDMNHIYSQLGEFFKSDFTHSGFEWIDFKDSEQSTYQLHQKDGAGRRRFLISGMQHDSHSKA